MLTKFFVKLFIPSRWTILAKEEMRGKRRSVYTYEWFAISGTQYTLQNQYGDLKFKTIWSDGSVN